MKVLFDVGYPLAWAEGGFSVQIRQTESELAKLGVNVQWVNRHDTVVPDADIIHYFGAPSSIITYRAGQSLGFRSVCSILPPHGFFSPSLHDYFMRFVHRGIRRGLGPLRTFGRMGMGFEDADAFIMLNEAERNYVSFMYGWELEKCHVIPEGVDDVFFDESVIPERVDGLFYPSYICPRKNQVEIARLAKQLKIKVVFAGRAQGEYPDYFNAFENELDGQYAVWLGDIQDRRRLASLYRGALGTFLASNYENQGIILLESLACGKPVMGPDFPALRTFFKDHIQYCPSVHSAAFSSALLRFDRFCAEGGRQEMKVLRWHDIARQVHRVYEQVLRLPPHEKAVV